MPEGFDVATVTSASVCPGGLLLGAANVRIQIVLLKVHPSCSYYRYGQTRVLRSWSGLRTYAAVPPDPRKICCRTCQFRPAHRPWYRLHRASVCYQFHFNSCPAVPIYCSRDAEVSEERFESREGRADVRSTDASIPTDSELLARAIRTGTVSITFNPILRRFRQVRVMVDILLVVAN